MEELKIYLALYPNTSGIGYVLLEGADEVLDYGIKRVRPVEKHLLLKQAEKLLEYAKPDIIILRATENDTFPVSKKQQAVLSGIVQLAKRNNLQVYSYTRNQIQETFSIFHGRTKHEIAKQIAEWYPQLKDKVPMYRKAYMKEPYSMGLFDAFSLAVTHFYLSV